MTDAAAAPDPRHPDWPLSDLLRAAEAHWNDAARLRLLARDLAPRADAGARDLLARVDARLRDLPADPAPRLRVIRRDPAPRLKPAPLPNHPTPEMATLLRELALERASGQSARQEAETLRQRLEEQRARPEGHVLRQELEAARAEARRAREEAARLAERLAFASASPGRRDPAPPAEGAARPGPDRASPGQPRPDPGGRRGPDPAYAELGLSPDLPDDLLPVLERALLRHHHPDRAPPEGREAATRRFQSVTRAFARIRQLRGL